MEVMEEMNMNDFKQVISLKRKQLNMTQKELADKVNVSDKLVSKWERGMSYPDLTMIHTLAKALNIDVKELLMLPEFVSPREEASFNQASIARFSIKYMIAVILTVLSIFILLMATINGINEILFIILLILAVTVLSTGMIIHITANIQFKAYFDDQKHGYDDYQHVYVQKNNIYLDAFLIPIVFLLVMNSFPGNGILNVNLSLICASLATVIYGFKCMQIYFRKQTFKHQYLNWILVFTSIVALILLIGNIVINSWFFSQWAEHGERILYELIGVHWTSKLLTIVNVTVAMIFIFNSGWMYFMNKGHDKNTKTLQ